MDWKHHKILFHCNLVSWPSLCHQSGTIVYHFCSALDKGAAMIPGQAHACFHSSLSCKGTAYAQNRTHVDSGWSCHAVGPPAQGPGIQTSSNQAAGSPVHICHPSMDMHTLTLYSSAVQCDLLLSYSLATSAPSPFYIQCTQLECKLFSIYLPLAHLKLLFEQLSCIY